MNTLKTALETSKWIAAGILYFGGLITIALLASIK
jgi:hypothetical protein